MIRPRRLIFGSLLALAGALVVGAAPAPAAAPDLEGEWEGFLAETPARLTRIGVAFEPDAGGWKGTADIPGVRGLPLDAIRLDGAEVHFELRVGDDRVLFDGELEGSSITGRAGQGERTVPVELHKLPEYPPPADRVEAWTQDLDAVRNRFLRYDRSFDDAARARFEAAIDRLEAALPELDDPQVVVALSEAVALSGNAHTRLYLLRNRTELRRLPIQAYGFRDGLFVVRATAEHRRALGCRVDGIGGHDPRKVRERVARLFAGNPSWVDYKSPFFMTSPEILYGTGLIARPDRVQLRFDCEGREPFERDLEPPPLERKDEPTEPWRALSPAWRGDGWISALPAGEKTPLYLRRPDRPYWLEPLPAQRALYLHYSRSQNAKDGPSFADFAADVESLIERQPPAALILDLRFNTGGSTNVAAPFLKRLAALEKSNKIGQLFVIIGRATFSAGISHAAYLKQHTGAIFVGEPVGDELDYWSEGGNVVLPNSGLTVHFTNGCHSLSNVERPELEPYFWADLDVEDLAPDVPVEASSDDYFSGRDPALEAVLARIPAVPAR